MNVDQKSVGQWALLLSPLCAIWDAFVVRRMPDLIGMDSPEVVALATDDLEMGEVDVEITRATLSEDSITQTNTLV